MNKKIVIIWSFLPKHLDIYQNYSELWDTLKHCSQLGCSGTALDYHIMQRKVGRCILAPNMTEKISIVWFLLLCMILIAEESRHPSNLLRESLIHCIHLGRTPSAMKKISMEWSLCAKLFRHISNQLWLHQNRCIHLGCRDLAWDYHPLWPASSHLRPKHAKEKFYSLDSYAGAFEHELSSFYHNEKRPRHPYSSSWWNRIPSGRGSSWKDSTRKLSLATHLASQRIYNRITQLFVFLRILIILRWWQKYYFGIIRPIRNHIKIIFKITSI